MGKMHISEDGVARACEAQTPESCTAKTLAGESKHFDNAADAEEYTQAKLKEIYGSSQIMKKSEHSTEVQLKTMIEEATNVKIGSNFSGESKEVLNVLMDLNPNIDKIKDNGELIDHFENMNKYIDKTEIEKTFITRITANTYEDSLNYLVEVCQDKNVSNDDKRAELEFFDEEVQRANTALSKMGVDLPPFNRDKFANIFKLEQRQIS